jgi:hypothetical protein
MNSLERTHTELKYWLKSKLAYSCMVDRQCHLREEGALRFSFLTTTEGVSKSLERAYRQSNAVLEKSMVRYFPVCASEDAGGILATQNQSNDLNRKR